MLTPAYYPRQSRPHQKFDKPMSTVAADFRHLSSEVLLDVASRLPDLTGGEADPLDRAAWFRDVPR